jgi:NAD(P)-dependent dehydrogenase (short-subunit alcohol dehydrogenase family)
MPRLRRRSRAAVAAGAGLALGAAVAGVAVGYAAVKRLIAPPLRPYDLAGNVVVVTGGSRGLGLAMAREFARMGCKVAICARNEDRLGRAEEFLRKFTPHVFAAPCDVSNEQSVRRFIDAVRDRLGPIDILVANAGQMLVSPIENTTAADFERAMGVMFWGLVYPTLAVLPEMQRRRTGHIAAITSIGGKVSMPHMLPYSAAKFAAVGFCEGLRVEVRRHGIEVTNIVPGMMRTGSYLDAEFRGHARSESALFSLSATLPLISIDADRAARQAVSSIVSGSAERFITPQASLLARLNGLFPEAMSAALTLFDRLLPGADPKHTQTETGRHLESTHGFLYRAATLLGRRAARRLNQPEFG